MVIGAWRPVTLPHPVCGNDVEIIEKDGVSHKNLKEVIPASDPGRSMKTLASQASTPNA